MATCLEDTEETSNGSKLSRLLIDGGTERLQKTFDGIHPPATLAAVLHARRPILTRLRHKRIINSSQWDKLFPPSGAAPDSKQFDITLLYILLRNICRLTPPATGWDALPLATDTTLEANLTRIKFYRNEVYGHISSTGIPKTEFEHYWKEISGTLVALGMDQISIDIFKTSPLGTNDYLKLLGEWAISDQTVKEVTEKARRAAEDAKKEVKQTGEIVKVTQETAEQGMRESEKGRIAAEKTQQTAEQAMRESKEANLAAQDANMEAKKTRKEVEKLGSEVSALKLSPQMKENNSVLTTLARSNFTGHIKSLVDHHHPDTRTWILSDIQTFVESDQLQLMVVTARPGVGKSVLAAVTSQTMQDQDQLAACHFIDHGDSRRNSPRLIIQSIASHLCDSIPRFRQNLEGQLSRDVGKELSSMNCKELFALLLEEPLNGVQAPGKHKLIIIDALDECDPEHKEEFIKALELVLPKLPKWVKLLATSRPVRGMIPRINSMKAVSIEPANENGTHNLNDIKLYLDHHLHQLYPIASHHEMQAATLHFANATDGIFLIAYFMIDFAKEKHFDISELHQISPKGVSFVYGEYFYRLAKELSIDEDTICHFLEAIVAMQGPLPETLVLEILGLNGSSRKIKKDARQTLNRLSQLFIFADKHVSVFHKSLVDWLTGADEHDFSVAAKDGHGILAKHCLQYIRGVKSYKSFPPPLNNCERYALRFGFHHMLKAEVHKHKLKECLGDLEIIAAVYYGAWSSSSRPMGSIPEELFQILTSSFLPLTDFRELDLVVGIKYSPKLMPYTLLEAASLCSPSNELQKQAVQLLRTAKYKDLHLGCMYFEFTESEIELPHELINIDDMQIPKSNKFVLCLGNDMLHGGDEVATIFATCTDESSMIATYNFDTKKHTCVRLPEKSKTSCSISPDDRYVSVLTANYCELRDTHSLQLHKRLEAENELLCCCFLYDGSQLVTGHKDGKIRVWDVESGTVKCTLDRDGESVIQCIASPCTGHVLTVDANNAAFLWQSLHPPGINRLIAKDKMRAVRKPMVAFSPCGTKIAVAFDSAFHHQVEICCTESGSLLNSFQVKFYPLRSFGFLNDTHVLLEGGHSNPRERDIKMLNISGGTEQTVGFPYRCKLLRYRKTERHVPEFLCVRTCEYTGWRLLIHCKLHEVC